MKKAYVIAVVGSGGKTTFIRRMADIAVETGRKTAVMTTTHMWLPREHSAVGMTVEEAASLLEQTGMVYFGAEGQGKAEGKMTFPGCESYEYLCRKAGMVLVEADGSRCLPMKFPNWPGEPVIPVNTDAVFVLFGLSAVGQPLAQVCHRWKLGLGEDGEEAGTDPVTPELAADFLERGYLRPIRFRFPSAPIRILLNQADTRFRRKAGERIRDLLAEKGWECRQCQLRPVRIAVIYMASGFGSRFGENKLLKDFSGKALYRHGLDMFRELRRRLEKEEIHLEILVVSQYQEILQKGKCLEMGETVPWERAERQTDPDSGEFWTVENRGAGEGITASLRLGVKAAGTEADGYLFSVADQPWLSAETMERFVKGFQEDLFPGEKDICCLCCGGRRGNPVLFDKSYREQLLGLTGDRGGSRIMKEFPGRVMEFAAREEELKDIDYPENLQPDGHR